MMGLSLSAKGVIGEQRVVNVLNTLARNYEMYTLYNVILPNNSDNVTQIDALLFSKKVLLCIEVKAWTCLQIDIPDNTRYRWKATYDNQEVVNGASPIKQNDYHLDVIRDCSDNGYLYEPFVVFTENPKIINRQSNVGGLTDLISYITNKPDIYSSNFIKKEYETMKNLSEQYYSNFVIREFNRLKINNTDLF